MDCLFTADAPKLQKRAVNRGEDAPAFASPGLLVVCDGCGGSGSLTEIFRTAPSESADPFISRALKDVKPGEEYTWAYLGSRLASAAARDYLSPRVEAILASVGDAEALGAFAAGLALSIRSLFTAAIEEFGIDPSRGDRTYVLFASTLTAVVYGSSGKNTRAVVFSAGDSHALWWDAESGLQRISLVRLTGGADDFTDNSSAGGCVAGDRDFTIDFASYAALPADGVILACSDGFTDTFKPFEQERFICEWLMKPGAFAGPGAFGRIITEQFDRIGCSKYDDCSMAGAIIGYKKGKKPDIGAIRRGASSRLDNVVTNFCAPYSGAQTEYRKLREDPSRIGQDDIDAAYRVGIRRALKRAAEDGAGEALLRLVCSHPDFISRYVGTPAAPDEEPDGEECGTEKLSSDLEMAFRELFGQIAWIYGKMPLTRTTLGKKELDEILSLARDCRDTLSRRGAAGRAYHADAEALRTVAEHPSSPMTDSVAGIRKRAAESLKKFKVADKEYKAACDRFYTPLRDSAGIREYLVDNISCDFAGIEAFADEVKAHGTEAVTLRIDSLLAKCRELARRVREVCGAAYPAVRRKSAPVPEPLRVAAKEFIASRKNELVGMVFADPEAFYECTGITYDEYNVRLAAAEASAQALKAAVTAKTAVWARYKPGYERYKTASVSSFTQDH